MLTIIRILLDHKFFLLFVHFCPLLFTLSPQHFSPLFVLNCLVLCFLGTAAICFIHTSKTKGFWFHSKSFKYFDGCLISNAKCATASYTPNMSKILPLPIEITVTHPCIDEKPHLCHTTSQETAVFAISSPFTILEVKISCAASFAFFSPTYGLLYGFVLTGGGMFMVQEKRFIADNPQPIDLIPAGKATLKRRRNNVRACRRIDVENWLKMQMDRR